jgi:siderophore synthetase component
MGKIPSKQLLRNVKRREDQEWTGKENLKKKQNVKAKQLITKLTKKQKPSTATHSIRCLKPTSPPFTQSQPTPVSVTQSYQKTTLKKKINTECM